MDFVSLVWGGFPSSLRLIGSSEPDLQVTLELISVFRPLGSLHCVFQPSFLSDLFLSYCILRIFVSCLQFFWEQSRIKKKNSQNSAKLSGLVFFFFKHSVTSGLESPGRQLSGSSCLLLGVFVLENRSSMCKSNRLQRQHLQPPSACKYLPSPEAFSPAPIWLLAGSHRAPGA